MKKADLIVKSNAIFTGLQDRPEKGAVVITGKLITEVLAGEGVAVALESYSRDTKILDFGNRLIMPGFIDAHAHYFMGAIIASSYICKEICRATSEAETVGMLVEFAKAYPEAKRIAGFGWSQSNWKGAPLPDCRLLDQSFPNTPVYLMCADGHSMWVNTKALEESGITGGEILASGKIGKFSDGSLNGMLFEVGASRPAIEKMLTFTPEQMLICQKEFIGHIHSCGVTSVGDMSSSGLDEGTKYSCSVLKELEKMDALTLRIHLHLGLDDIEEYKDVLAYCAELESEKIRISGLKSFVDGVTSTYTAYLTEPYSDNPNTRGALINPEKTYAQRITQANGNMLGVRLHAIGDAENNNPGNYKEIRNSIEHIETILPEDIQRFAELGVIASMQPSHLILDANEKIARLGEKRSKYEWIHKTLMESGAHVAFGTDYPIIDFNPFPSVYAAVTRCDSAGNPSGINPEEKVSLTQALRAYTAEGAYVYGREKELGTLEPGKLADIVVVDRNPFEIPEFEIQNCKTIMTIVDGRIVFQE
ncbi:MAG: amidohydrolase [Anaerovorax sp.]